MNKIAKFFSDVKFEMSKVSWPNWDELKGSTFVVISFSILISVFLFFIDRILSTLMQVIL
ncbi:MAG: preprotein translocase subunit SecE [Candidatus Marinimicrobia bacterium]|jgi:preprotein translocase subunit SecE|nr:preprotein translocase subunit SecE [Candidatus Neomarinimicrobiota bacterium]MBT3947371.1 preprotein translocase subunit SecE [Candidatus Neomarinimicrobiota bacterium]MBT4065404.1 preprotein translocase subunit SecE [Candidatus Neomarinimicrobiota bacterium]MBT4307009.1 preprotein translocase subunit SecE [Candidatus Neomarinimicrobiota bacterium]MBT4452569.1 preprotein translocase subunit SecE [Candidatus Neomarinimicrobiota bacterium]